ncbi:hypothetical protein B0O99DRAFT_684791 [Bisporella sp. PMI_857]|nr:hypothetical protein B0O99DRAFT_684791 [Bisporella sp. PMI_857]
MGPVLHASQAMHVNSNPFSGPDNSSITPSSLRRGWGQRSSKMPESISRPLEPANPELYALFPVQHVVNIDHNRSISNSQNSTENAGFDITAACTSPITGNGIHTDQQYTSRPGLCPNSYSTMLRPTPPKTTIIPYNPLAGGTNALYSTRNSLSPPNSSSTHYPRFEQPVFTSANRFDPASSKTREARSPLFTGNVSKTNPASQDSALSLPPHAADQSALPANIVPFVSFGAKQAQISSLLHSSLYASSSLHSRCQVEQAFVPSDSKYGSFHQVEVLPAPSPREYQLQRDSLPPSVLVPSFVPTYHNDPANYNTQVRGMFEKSKKRKWIADAASRIEPSLKWQGTEQNNAFQNSIPHHNMPSTSLDHPESQSHTDYAEKADAHPIPLRTEPYTASTTREEVQETTEQQLGEASLVAQSKDFGALPCTGNNVSGTTPASQTGDVAPIPANTKLSQNTTNFISSSGIHHKDPRQGFSRIEFGQLMRGFHVAEKRRQDELQARRHKEVQERDERAFEDSLGTFAADCAEYCESKESREIARPPSPAPSGGPAYVTGSLEHLFFMDDVERAAYCRNYSSNESDQTSIDWAIFNGTHGIVSTEETDSVTGEVKIVQKKVAIVSGTV